MVLAPSVKPPSMDAMHVLIIPTAYHAVSIIISLEGVACCARIHLLDARYAQMHQLALAVSVDIISMPVVAISVLVFRGAKYVLMQQHAFSVRMVTICREEIACLAPIPYQAASTAAITPIARNARVGTSSTGHLNVSSVTTRWKGASSAHRILSVCSVRAGTT